MAGKLVRIRQGKQARSSEAYNAANANGAAERGFANPAGGNPSGVSGPASQPGSLPGLGDPNSGVDQGTPSFDPASRDERVDARSNR